MRQIIAGLVVGLLVGPAAQANIFINGDFETPAIGSGSYILHNPGDTSLTGWTILAQIAQDGTFICCGYTGLIAASGQDWLDMTGNNDDGTGGISQTVSTIVGHTYQLSFEIGNAVAVGGPATATSTITTMVAGAAAYSDTNASTSTSLQWQTVTHTFVATAASTAISFSNGDPAGDDLNGLDNVVLTDVTAPTPPPTNAPEPAALSLFALGALLTLGIKRHAR